MSESKVTLEHKAKFQEVRDAVKSEVENAKDSVYEADVRRIECDDVYLNQFLLHQRGDVTKATTMITDALKWRKTFGVREVVETSIPLELWQKGAMYFHNQDIDGNQIMCVNIALRHKGELATESQKLLVYLLEKANQACPDRQIMVLMDFTGAGITSIDIEFTKFMINCFKFYFPYFLKVLVNYEMPWLFNAAWKVIKVFLDEDAIKKIKFEGKKTIQNYIGVDQLAVHMGGTDQFKYIYDGPAKSS